MMHINWIDRGGKPTQAPNPEHPDGVDLDLTNDRQPFCQTELPYPAKRLGYYVIRCDVCGFTAMVSTAGRPDVRAPSSCPARSSR
jgi:hypothetical protein